MDVASHIAKQITIVITRCVNLYIVHFSIKKNAYDTNAQRHGISLSLSKSTNANITKEREIRREDSMRNYPAVILRFMFVVRSCLLHRVIIAYIPRSVHNHIYIYAVIYKE